MEHPTKPGPGLLSRHMNNTVSKACLLFVGVVVLVLYCTPVSSDTQTVQATPPPPPPVVPCLESCPDGWTDVSLGVSWLPRFIRGLLDVECTAPESYRGPCNYDSKFGHKYTRYKRVQWAQNCGPIPWTACGYTKEMASGKAETPHLDDFDIGEDNDEL